MMGVNNLSFAASDAERIVCQSAGWYWPNRNWIIVCERPTAIRRDDDGRLHCETGPAVDYGDTFRLYSWRGTSIPAHWIENRKSLTAQTALTWRNVEQRRAACEILGWSKILDALDARVINKHRNPQIGTLLEVDIPDSGPERFLKVQCGTGRVFALPVPRQITTAMEAQAWTYGLDPNEFSKPEVRT